VSTLQSSQSDIKLKPADHQRLQASQLAQIQHLHAINDSIVRKTYSKVLANFDSQVRTLQDQLNAAVNEKQALIKQLTARIEANKLKIRQLELLVAKQNAQIAQQGREIQASNETIKTQETTISAKDVSINNFRPRLLISNVSLLNAPLRPSPTRP
jgi:DNA replication initiation complex subunit (GINS family)